MLRRTAGFTGMAALLWAVMVSQAMSAEVEANKSLRFSRHVIATFSRVGCNAGSCHGAVKGQNGFRLSLFGAEAESDYAQVVRAEAGRRINRAEPTKSLILLKAAGVIPHGGGRVIKNTSSDYKLLRRWIASGAPLDIVEQSKIATLLVTPSERTIAPGKGYDLRVTATFADGTVEDVTDLCSYRSLVPQVATIDPGGHVRAAGIGDTAIIVRFRSEPVIAMVVVPRPKTDGAPSVDVKPHNFIDEHILAKLKRLNIPPSELADDVTFLRRATLDVTGEIPTAKAVRDFLTNTATDKREKKIDEFLSQPGYAALWTLKFCDILGASDFGVYADGMKKEYDTPRFSAWVRARLRENTPYDEFATRIILATSRDGRSLKEWSNEVIALHEGFAQPRRDLEVYSRRKTLDLYWQRRAANGVKGTLQLAHSFLGLRLECAQCHRHPHDVWRQDDLLSFANFFMGVRTPGFQGQNAKKYPEAAKLVEEFGKQAKQLTEQAKTLKAGEGKTLDAEAKKAKVEFDKLNRQVVKLTSEADRLETQAKQDAAKASQLKKAAQQKRDEATLLKKLSEPFQVTMTRDAEFKKKVGAMERKGKFLPEAGKRVLHAEIFSKVVEKQFASVTSPLGTQTSEKFRILGETDAVEISKDEDPRRHVAEWLRRPDNPFFAKAIVNRVWAHYFGRGIVNPPDDLSPLNPPSHPELLDELCRRFIKNGYDLKWLHRTILKSRTYQQSSLATKANRMDRSNYASFYLRRLPAEVLLDTLNQATGTTENMDMKYWNWPENLKTVEIPYMPRNSFVTFMLEQFGRPKRNSAIQCDCERDSNASVLQVMSFANHPHVWKKIADSSGRAARILKNETTDSDRIDEVFLGSLSRFPSDDERKACIKYLSEAETPAKGLQGVLWSLLNTREFLLQH
jgi:hypothetical protein